MKSISVLLSAVLITAISIAAIAIVLFTGLPAIEKSKEALYLSEAKTALTSIDNALRTVLSEGQGSSRAVPISVSAGQYFFDSSAERIYFEMEQTSFAVEKGIFKKEGNLYISTGADVNASDNSTDLTLENSRLLVIINKTGSSSSYSLINTSSLIKTIRLKELNADLNLSDSQLYVNSVANTYSGTGYTSLSQTGENLKESSAKAFIQTAGYQYEVHYTLRANADFLLIEVKNSNASIANYTVYFTAHLGTNKNNDVLNVTIGTSPTFNTIIWTTTGDFDRGTHVNTTSENNDLILVYANQTDIKGEATAIASSESSYCPTYGCVRYINDTSETTYWYADTDTKQWINYTFQRNITTDKMGFRHFGGGFAGNWINYNCSFWNYSADGWTVLFQVTGNTNQYRNHTFSAVTSDRFSCVPVSNPGIPPGAYSWYVWQAERNTTNAYYTSNITSITTPTSLTATWNLTNATRDQNITVELSTDGTTWLTVQNNTQYTSGYGSGSNLRWRANFSTNDTNLTPYLHNINITYSYFPSVSTTDLCLYDTTEFSSPVFLGLTSEGLISGSITNYTSDYKLALNSTLLKTYLAFSKGRCDVFRKHKPSIEAKTFLEALKAFSYSFNNTLQLVLKYANVDILSDLQFGKGSYNVYIENTGYNQTTNKKMIDIKILK